ncbi:MAG: hypothetical protein AB8B99_00665 [Phormidesmis sp.]
MLNRLSDIPSPSIFSKSLLFRSAFMAALIALIYCLQLMAEPKATLETSSPEEDPSSKAEIPIVFPALDGQLEQ